MSASAVHYSLVFLNAYDPLLAEQTRIASEICSKMAQSPYFKPEERDVLLMAAATYHIGFIKLDRSLLPQRIRRDATPEERELYNTHPAISAAMARELGMSEEVALCIEEHHESFFNGNKDPEAIQHPMLSWPGRCLAVAAYFAESCHSREETLARILAESGVRFDPEAVRLFFKMTQDDLPAQVREVMVDELAPGMRLADGILTPQGMLLVPEGTVLDESSVKIIQNYNAQGEVTKRLIVYR